MVRLPTAVFSSLSLCLFLLFLLIGCKKRIANRSDSDVHSDSLEYYLENAKNFEVEHKRRDEYCKKALTILNQFPTDTTNLKKRYNVAIRYYNMDSIERYKNIVKNTLNIAIENNDEVNIGNGYRLYADYFNNTFKYDSAFYYYRKASILFLREDRHDKIAQIKNSIAECYINIGDMYKAEEKVLELLMQKNLNPMIKNDCYIKLGLILFSRQDFEGSLKYYLKALRIVENNKELKLLLAEPGILNNIGNVYRDKKNYNKAIEYYNKVKNYDHNMMIEDPIMIARALRNSGRIYLEINQFEKAFSNLKEAEKIVDDTNFKPLKINLLNDFSDYYLEIKDSVKSKQFALENLRLSKKMKNTLDVIASFKQLIKVDSENAAYHTNEYIRIRDSLDLANNTLKYKFSRIEFETDEIILEKEKAVQDKWLIASIAILVITLGGLLYIIKWQRTRQKELVMINNQQKASEEIYQLILDQQIKFDEGREKEKKRIARELHDGVMNKLAGIRFNLFKLEKKQDSETIEDCLHHVSELHQVEKEIRNIAHDLNMEVFSPKNDYTALIEILTKENDTYDFDLILEMDKAIEWNAISAVIKMNCYRILQESFSNIVKHAESQKVEVRFSQLNGFLKLEIIDDGVGFDFENQKKGLGIKNISERAQSMKAICNIKSESGKGTTIRIEIPLEEVLP